MLGYFTKYNYLYASFWEIPDKLNINQITFYV